MRDQTKTKRQLIAELGELRQRVAELETSEVDGSQAAEADPRIVENSLQGILIGQDSRLIFVNQAFAEIVGYDVEHLVSLSPEGVQALIHPEDRDLVWGRFQDRLAGEAVPPGYEFRMIRRGGETVWLEMFASLIDYQGQPAVQVAVVDITKWKRAEQDLKRRAAQLATLHEVSAAVASHLSPQEIFDAVVEKLSAEFGYRLIGIYLLDDGVLELKAHIGYGSAAHSAHRVPLERGVVGRTARTGLPQLVTNVEQDPEFFFGAPGITSEVCVPLKRGEEVLGVLNVESDRVDEPLDAADLELLELLSNHVVAAIENARAYDAAEQELAERQRAEEALQRLMEFNKSIVQNMGEGIVLTDMEDSMIFTNRATDRLLGYDDQELVGQQWTVIVPPDQRAVVATALDRRAQGESDSYQLELVRKDGTRVDVLVSGDPRFEDGRFAGSLAVFTDITELKRAEEARRSSEQRLKILFEFAPDAYYLSDFRGNFVDGNRAAEELMGYEREELIGKNFLRLKLLPLHQIPKAASALAQNALGRPTGPDEFTLRRKDGGFVTAEIRTYPVRLQGEALVLGIARDITARKRAEEAMRASEEKYRSLFEHSRDAVLITTRDGEFADANDSCLRLFGYTRQEMMQLCAGDLYMDPTDEQRFEREIEQRGTVAEYEVRLRNKSGAKMDCLLTATARTDKDGHILGYEGIVRDITTQKQAEETIRHLAYHDPLTGLPNRSLFNDRLGVALARARRNREKLGVMLLDLDRFKDVNDRLGHSVGDQLLQAAGNRLVGILRESDTVCRMGGDEFLLLLPQLGRPEDGDILAERVAQTIRRPFALGHHQVSMTTSVGIAIYPEDGEDAESLLKNADVAMYRAKAEGRDNYQRYTPASGGKEGERQQEDKSATDR